MFPIDWQSPAVKDLLMLATEEGDRSPSPAPAGRNGARFVPAALRRQVGTALVRLGLRLQGTEWPVGAPTEPAALPAR